MWEDYPWPLKYSFFLICLSFCSYVLIIILIIAAKLYQYYYIRLLLNQAFAQSSLLLVQIIIPYFIYPHGDPLDESQDLIQVYSINYKLVETIIILTSWLSTNIFSILILRTVLSVLQGNEINMPKRREIFLYFGIYVFSIFPMLMYWKFEEKGFQNCGWTYHGTLMKSFCSLRLSKQVGQTSQREIEYYSYILISVDFLFVSAAVYLSIKINQQKKIVQNLGAKVDDLIIRIYIITILQLALWTVNGAFKIADNIEGYYHDFPGVNIILAFVNCIYSYEGFLVAILFLNSYFPLIKSRLNWRILHFNLNLFRKQSQVNYLHQHQFDSGFSDITESLTETIQQEQTDTNQKQRSHTIQSESSGN